MNGLPEVWTFKPILDPKGNFRHTAIDKRPLNEKELKARAAEEAARLANRAGEEQKN